MNTPIRGWKHVFMKSLQCSSSGGSDGGIAIEGIERVDSLNTLYLPYT